MFNALNFFKRHISSKNNLQYFPKKYFKRIDVQIQLLGVKISPPKIHSADNVFSIKYKYNKSKILKSRNMIPVKEY